MSPAWLTLVQEPAHAVGALFGTLAAILLATSILGGLAQRSGQPAVLGELLAGVILGGSALAILDPADPTIGGLAQIGVVLLLFQIGLHTDLRGLIKVG